MCGLPASLPGHLLERLVSFRQCDQRIQVKPVFLDTRSTCNTRFLLGNGGGLGRFEELGPDRQATSSIEAPFLTNRVVGLTRPLTASESHRRPVHAEKREEADLCP